MPNETPLMLSRGLLTTLGIRTFHYYQHRIPPSAPLLLVSNHRSILDVPLLMDITNRPIRFACHHYMSQVPILREIVNQIGALPLNEPGQSQHEFFRQAVQLLQQQEAIGIFPEGAEPMVQPNPADEVGEFHRGFAHLALKAPVDELAVLPIAIASNEEHIHSLMPLRVFSWFDPSEPLFRRSGWHPMVNYRRVNILVGRPFWITDKHREQYQGKQVRSAVTDLTNYCHQEIQDLLSYGCV